MPISGGIASGGGGGYLALTNTNRIIGSNAGAGNASDEVIFMGASAGAANAGARNIGAGIDAARNAFTTDLIVIGNHCPTRIGETGGNTGGILIGNNVLDTFQPSALHDLESSVFVGLNAGASLNFADSVTGNVGIGHEVLRGNSTGGVAGLDALAYNVAIGYRCGAGTTVSGGADNSVLIGARLVDNAAIRASVVESSVLIGAFTARAIVCASSVIIGTQAVLGTVTTYSGTTQTESANDTVLGYGAGNALRRSFSQTIIGAGAANTLEHGDENVCIGAETLLTGVVGASAVCVGNLVLGYQAGLSEATNYVIAIGRRAGRSATSIPDSSFYLEGAPSALNANAVPFLYGNLVNGNLMLGNRENAGGPLSRAFGTGAVNNFKIQEGTAPSTAPDNGASLYVQNTAGVYSLRVIGPGGVAQVLATGL